MPHVRLDNLPETLRPREAAQPHGAHLAQRNGIREPTCDRIGDGLREEDLPAVSGAHDPASPIDGAAEVIVVTTFDDADVKADPDTQREAVRGERIGECALHGDCCAHAAESIGECRADAVTGGLDDRACVLLDGVPHEDIVTRERNAHPIGILLPQPSTPLDVGEENRDGRRMYLE